MQKILQLISITAIATTVLKTANAQTVSTFESLNLTPNSYWDGAASPGGATFTDGNAVFPNVYDSSFFYWASGWAYSNMQDSITSGFTNNYSAITAAGFNGSNNYAVGNLNPIINLNATAIGKVVNGFYVTNTTFAALSMRDGDAFAKKFGGITGNDPDWYKLTIIKWFGGAMTNDSVEFYLADYRFVNNAQDYIIKTWQWVDLTSLGNVDSLQMTLSSSDMGSFGMNTPAFFCIDNFTTADSPLSINDAIITDNVNVYPNPAKEALTIDLRQNLTNYVANIISVYDVTGRKMMMNKIYDGCSSISVEQLPAGVYTVVINDGVKDIKKPFVKE